MNHKEKRQASSKDFGLSQEGIDAFLKFLNSQPNKQLPIHQLNQFYDANPNFRDCFKGKFKTLLKTQGGKLCIEGGSHPYFELRDVQTTETVEEPNNETHESLSLNQAYGGKWISNESELATFRDDFIGLGEDWVLLDVDVDYTRSLEAVHLILSNKKIGLKILDIHHFPTNICEEILKQIFMQALALWIVFDIQYITKSLEKYNLKFSKVLDLQVAYKTLIPDYLPHETYLSNLLEAYDVHPRFIDECERPTEPSIFCGATKLVSIYTRYMDALSELAEKVIEDAYSQSKTESCIQKSILRMNQPSPVDLTKMDMETLNLTRSPFPKTSFESVDVGLRKRAQSFKARVANAKRALELQANGQPVESCIEYYIRTPGFCSHGEKCKFKHDLDAVT